MTPSKNKSVEEIARELCDIEGCRYPDKIAAALLAYGNQIRREMAEIVDGMDTSNEVTDFFQRRAKSAILATLEPVEGE